MNLYYDQLQSLKGELFCSGFSHFHFCICGPPQKQNKKGGGGGDESAPTKGKN